MTGKGGLAQWTARVGTCSPLPSGVGLFGVRALSEGTVVAVGSGSNNYPVILPN